MGTAALKVTPSKAGELEAIMEIPIDKIDALREQISSENVNQITTFSAFKASAQRLLPSKSYMPFVRNCLSLSEFTRRQEMSTKDTLDALTVGLTRFGWPPEKMSKWEGHRDALERILSSEPISFISKIADLALTHDNHLHDVKLLTEMRPVFDEPRGEIKAFIVYNELMLFYHDSDKERAVTITLSIEDLETLKLGVDNALKKTQIAREFANKAIGTETVVYSDTLFGDDEGDPIGESR